jgi:hypothetical protein
MLRAVSRPDGFRYGSKATALGVFLCFGLQAPLVLASKKVRQPTRSDLATVWVGGEPEDPLEYFRLELDANGTGILTVQYLPGKPAVAYRVVGTSLSGYAVKLEIKAVDSDAQPLQAQGEAVPGLLRLHVTNRALDWRRDVQLQRYDQLLERIRVVTEKAQVDANAKQ